MHINKPPIYDKKCYRIATTTQNLGSFTFRTTNPWLLAVLVPRWILESWMNAVIFWWMKMKLGHCQQFHLCRCPVHFFLSWRFLETCVTRKRLFSSKNSFTISPFLFSRLLSCIPPMLYRAKSLPILDLESPQAKRLSLFPRMHHLNWDGSPLSVGLSFDKILVGP